MTTVLTAGGRRVPVGPAMEAGELILHAALPPARGFTVSHKRTGASVFTGQPREVAEYFFRTASDWQEWKEGWRVQDFEPLRARVMKLRKEAEFIVYVMQAGDE